MTFAVIGVFFKSPHRKAEASTTWQERTRQLDPYGTAVFIPAIVCLLLALQWGGSKYPWHNGRIIALFIVFGVLITAFIAIQFWKGDFGTVPPRIISQRSMASAAWFSLCLGGGFFILVYYLPIWFQAIKGVSATKSGIMSLPLILGLVFMSLIAGVAITALGYYTPAFIVSSILMSIGAGLLTTFKTNTNHSMWIGYQALYGFGVGFGMQQSLIAAQTVLKLDDVPVGTAVIMFTQILGGALFISVGQNVFTNRLLSGLQSQVPGLDPTIVLKVGATSLKEAVPARFLDSVQVAYNKALTDTWYVSVALSCLSIIGAAFMEWKSVKGKKIETVAA